MRFSSYKKILSDQVSGFHPESGWKKSSRDVLLAQIRQTKHWQQTEERFSFGSVFSTIVAGHMLRPVLAGFLVFTTIMYSSVITVQAAKASLPGDTLYPVKLGIEDAQVRLVFSEEKKAELEVKFAGTRLQEVKEIIGKEVILGLDPLVTKQNKQEVQRNIKKAIQGFSDNIGSVQKHLEKIEKEPQSEGKILEISKLINEKTTKLEDDLLAIKEKITELRVKPDETVEPAELDEELNVVDDATIATTTTDVVATTTIDVVATTTIDINIEEEIIEEGDFLDALETALNAIDEANTKSLEVFVGKAAESGNEEVKQDAVAKLQNKIEKVEKNISNASDKIIQIAEKSSAENLDKESITVAAGENTEAQTKPEQAQEAINEVKKMIDENKTGELNQAVEKMIQAKAIVKEAEQNIKNVENQIDKKLEEVKKDNQNTENIPASIEKSNNNESTGTTTQQLIEDPAKSTQLDPQEDLS